MLINNRYSEFINILYGHIFIEDFKLTFYGNN